MKIENISLIIYLCVENGFVRGSILMLVEVAIPSIFCYTTLWPRNPTGETPFTQLEFGRKSPPYSI